MNEPNDIVTRLREVSKDAEPWEIGLLLAAAREIERLRMDVNAANEFLRGDTTLVIDEQDAANLFRLSRDMGEGVYTVKLADLYRLAADHRGRNEPDSETDDE